MSERPQYPVHVLPPELRDLIDNTRLDPALLAGAGMAAMAIAAASAELYVDGDPDPVRPILWIPLIGRRSSGKSPAMNIAFRQLYALERKARQEYKEAINDWDVTGKKDAEPEPVDTTRIMQDATIEILGRKLGESPFRSQVSDELASLIEKLGAYKPGGGGDRDKWLELWTGSLWRYNRVGSGRRYIDEWIDSPVVTVCGGLQDTSHRLALLGETDSGFRARWLPHLATTSPGTKGDDTEAKEYNRAIVTAYKDGPRAWYLRGPALRLWHRQGVQWKKLEEEGADTEQALAGLSKADTQCLRIALVLAEFSDNGPGDISVETMKAAIAIVDYCIDVWRALEPTEYLSRSAADEKYFRAAEKWHERVVRAGSAVPLTELSKAKVAGVRTAEQVADVLDEYGKNWMIEERKERGRNGRTYTTTWLLADEVDPE